MAVLDVRRGSVVRAAGGVAGALLLVAAVTGCGGDKKAAAAAAPSVLDGFSKPESVLVAGDKWFVSNIGATQEPMTKDGDGFLTRLDANGKVIERKAIPRAGDPPLNAPKGMAFADNKVFVADIDRVVGYDVDTLGQVFEAPLGGDAASLLDDIAVLDDKTLLVTDTVRGSVYKLDLETKKYGTLTTAIPGANGIVLDKSSKTAYVAALGAYFEGGNLYKLGVEQAPAAVGKVGTVHGILDGIALLPNGDLAVSDWVASDNPAPGVIKIYHTDGTEVTTVKLPGELHGPADFTLDGAGKNLLVPAIADDKVAIVALP
ncbi:hypothetical protein OG874_04135 [Nocardia sp. NBC_00565]|uniref:SMP-30/gluconolactonase/LRE family protein n=1 Tax=Nocardia sp. NBC_00565 TaxID=2975993 RepID=UPI002E809DC2|nr:hypothetical protein [Nocardia sp. NBC_00565]WUC04402.1 hypothetical protein OG874_04135 [Nocardia sp. NBC_00565]